MEVYSFMVYERRPSIEINNKFFSLHSRYLMRVLINGKIRYMHFDHSRVSASRLDSIDQSGKIRTETLSNIIPRSIIYL